GAAGGRAADKKPDAPAKPLPPLPTHLWLEPEPRPDIPIVFVHAGTEPAEWAKLKDYWNHFPPPAAGQRTAHLGLSPLGARVALLATDRLDVIKIKVPIGLPDPTPYVPSANPLTFAKWRLGQKLFYDPSWLYNPARDRKACADCHSPRHGF